MDEISYIYTCKRRDFGKPCHFTNVGPDILVEIDPDPDLKSQFHIEPFTHRSCQTETRLAISEVNTDKKVTESRGMNHVEGGWPAKVDLLDEDSTTRYRKNIEKDKDFVKTVQSLGETLESLVMENKSIDIYEEYFPDSKGKPKPISSLQTLNVFTSPSQHHPIRDLSFSHDASHFCASQDDLEMSYVWACDDTYRPSSVLHPEIPMTCVEFSRVDSNVLAGGYVGGQVAVWDLRSGEKPVRTSDAGRSHIRKVTGLKWISEFLFTSTSTDGLMSTWDSRDLSRRLDTISVLKIHLDGTPPSPDDLHCITCLDFDPTHPNVFLVGTERGDLISLAGDDSACYHNDQGPILKIERNAFFHRLFASCDPWTIKIWAEETRHAPVMILESPGGYNEDMAWSPKHPCLLYVAKSTGDLEVWSVPGNCSCPTTISTLDNTPLTSITVSDCGTKIALGTRDGIVHLLSVPQEWMEPSEEEFQLVAKSFLLAE